MFATNHVSFFFITFFFFKYYGHIFFPKRILKLPKSTKITKYTKSLEEEKTLRFKIKDVYINVPTRQAKLILITFHVERATKQVFQV